LPPPPFPPPAPPLLPPRFRRVSLSFITTSHARRRRRRRYNTPPHTHMTAARAVRPAIAMVWCCGDRSGVLVEPAGGSYCAAENSGWHTAVAPRPYLRGCAGEGGGRKEEDKLGW
jgi:hypothetical protein